MEGYDGNSIIVEVERILKAESNSELEEIKLSVGLGEKVLGDSLILYITGIGKCFCQERRHDSWGSSFHYDFNHWDYDYDFEFNFKLKIPAGTRLIASTINDGDVTIQNMEGDINAKNINGSIILTNLRGKTKARTINGDVLIDYQQKPVGPSKFYTLNGDIRANFNLNLDATVAFKSYNGDLYTNIHQMSQQPLKVEKSEVKDGHGIKYKIGEVTEFVFRQGGTYLDFETFNGDVFIKEIN